MLQVDSISVIMKHNMLSSDAKNLHLKGLSGLRAIAAMAVVVSHTLLSGTSLGLGSHQGSDLAGFGVTIFFSLSGFLITYLLLIEKERFKTINIKAFYIRRVLRIWPLYYLYLLVSFAIIYFFNLTELPGSAFYYIFLLANVPFFTGPGMPLIGHYWSLGVEEQFYLFWPWIVKRTKNILRFLIIFIFAFIALKIAFRVLYSTTNLQWPYMAIQVTRFECMAIGATGAVLVVENSKWFFRIMYHPLSQLIAWSSIALMAFNKFHIASVIDNDIVALLTVILIINVAMNPATFIKLENKVFDFLGKISFGMYVYHPLIIFFTGRYLSERINSTNSVVRYLVIFCVIIGLTILIAWLSYTFFEKKFLKLKLKFALVPSSASKGE